MYVHNIYTALYIYIIPILSAFLSLVMEHKESNGLAYLLLPGPSLEF